jgi:GNAT superfamily N-acetyltransferase
MPKKRFHETIPNPYNRASTTKIVADALLRAPLIGALDNDPVHHDTILAFYLGSNSNINGRIYLQDDRTVASIDYFCVSKQLCRRGLGERLLKAFIATSKEIGATELWSESVSNPALGLRARVLGSRVLQFYDGTSLDEGMLPMTLDQARLSNDRIDYLNTLNPDRSYPIPHVGVYVDLQAINTSNWETPECLLVGDDVRPIFVNDYCE